MTLTNVNYCGEFRAERLREVGIEDATDLAEQEAHDLADQTYGISQRDCALMISSARDQVDNTDPVVEKDELDRLVGVGSQGQRVLRNNGYQSFRDVAEADARELHETIQNDTDRAYNHDTTVTEAMIEDACERVDIARNPDASPDTPSQNGVSVFVLVGDDAPERDETDTADRMREALDTVTEPITKLLVTEPEYGLDWASTYRSNTPQPVGLSAYQPQHYNDIYQRNESVMRDAEHLVIVESGFPAGIFISMAPEFDITVHHEDR
jgi:hypothetical protein